MTAEPTNFEARVEAAGLAHLLPNFRPALLKAIGTADEIAGKLVLMESPACEPATVFSLAAQA